MSGILRRTVFSSRKTTGVVGTHIFHDWARVETGVGQCVEPFQINARPTQSAYDDDDEMRRVDVLEQIGPDRLTAILSDGEDIRLHGGALSPVG